MPALQPITRTEIAHDPEASRFFPASDTYRTPDSPLGRALAQGRLAAAAQRWTCDSRCPGLRVQVGGELKERHLGLIHAQTGMTVASRVLRWPPTSEGLDLALEASEQAKGLRPENAWLLEDPWRGDLASAQAAIRSLARKVGSPSIWYVGGSAPLKGWPEEVRRTAEETAKERRAPVEVLGYADGQDLREQIPMVTYRVDPR